jgi:hypothetical protein
MKMTKQTIIEQAAPIIDEYKTLWEKWGFKVEPISETTPLDFTWAIKWQGTLVRPLQISVWERQNGQTKNYGILLVSDEKIDYYEVDDQNDKRRKNWLYYFRKGMERLTEYLVLAAARAQAIVETKTHIRKAGKPLYITIGDQRYAILFRLGTTTWTWAIRKWQSQPPYGWVKVDSIRGQHKENPIPVLSRIARALPLSAL